MTNKPPHDLEKKSWNQGEVKEAARTEHFTASMRR